MREDEARHHVVGLQSQGDPLHDTMKVKPKLYLKSQDTGDARTLDIHQEERETIQWTGRGENLCVLVVVVEL